MNSINENIDHSAIEEQAGAWVIKLDGDSELSRSEQLALKEWMGRGPAHREAIKSLAQFWGKMNVLTELSMPQQQSQQDQEILSSSRKSDWLQLFGSKFTALAFSLCLMAGVFWLQLDPSHSTDNGLYATAVGQQQTIMLNDGSELQLNTNSQIKIHYSRGYRDIYLLQGEAHFTVASNKNRPFRVLAGRGLVRAIGTAFSVYLDHDNVEVMLTEGRVALQLRQPDNISTDSVVSSGKMAEAPATIRELGQLTAGQTAVIKSVVSDSGVGASIEASIDELDPQDMARKLSWRKGFILFKGTPLDQVLEEVSRYSQISIELTDPAMAAIKIGGQFRVGEVDAIFESLENNFGLKIKRLSYNQVQIHYL